MRKILLLTALLAPGIVLASSKDPGIQNIIQRFARREAEFKALWQKYTYTQHIYFQVLGRSDQVREQREMVVEVYFTSDGKRQLRTLTDRGHLRSVGVTREDLDDAIQRQPFVLTSEQLPNYKIHYRGKEHVDELDTYVFDVKPRKIKKHQRYFKGRIWVDDQDLQIVMTRGKIVPDYSNNKFPEFETVREQIDGTYWFPTWTQADDILRFGGGRPGVHIRELITYENFKKFDVDTSITFAPVKKP